MQLHFCRMNIGILINTYQRPELLLDLLKDIKSYGKDFSLDILVLEDKSAVNYSKPLAFLKQNFKSFYHKRTSYHFGKQGYWQIIKFGYRYFKDRKINYFIHLPDDVRLVPDFFSEAINRFNAIMDKVIALNILNDGRLSQRNWVRFSPVRVTANGYNYYHTNWLDLCLISGKDYLTALDYTIHPIKVKSSKLSSGVGRQISRRLVTAGKSIFLVDRSLVIHGNHPSKMNPEVRKKNPLITNHRTYNDKVIAGMATIRSRYWTLTDVVKSIANQVDELHIYLNDYDKPNPNITYPNVIFHSGVKSAGDIGDAGKFYAVDGYSGYYLSLDDDLIYPPDYVEKLIDRIEHYNRKAIISFHGRELKQGKIENYYSRSSKKLLRCLRTVEYDQYVHIGGTGVMGFHTDTVNVSVKDFKIKNMADVWMGKLAQKQKVPIIVAGHKVGWIKHASIDMNKTIAAKGKRSFELVTKIVNQNKWIMNKLENNGVIDIVIPYINHDKDFQELKYMLRSLEKNFLEDYRVVLIGEKPDWLTTENVEPERFLFIPQERLGGMKFANCIDANRKINTIILSPEISEKFVVVYDDVYFLRHTELKDLKPYSIAKAENLKPTSVYRELLLNTFSRLEKEGFTSHNCETHLPRLIDKKQMIEVYQRFLPIRNRLLIYSLYFNYYYANELTELTKGDGIKLGFYGKSNQWSFANKKKVDDYLKAFNKYHFLNHDDNGLTPELAQAIEEAFPDKSIFEK